MSLLDRVGQAVVGIYQQPLHPVIGGVAPGGGFGAGLSFEPAVRRPWTLSLDGLVTTRRYWALTGAAGLAQPRWEAEVYGRARYLRSLDFYGLGPDSDAGQRSVFALRERSFGVRGSAHVTPWAQLRVRAERMEPEVEPGRSSQRPSTEARFDAASAPGLAQQPHFARYGAALELHFPGVAGEGWYQGTQLRAAYDLYDDLDLARHSFQRAELEVVQRFGVLGYLRRLTLSGWLSTTTDGDNVPFYLQRTLGGVGDVRAYGEERLTARWSQASLRGFPTYRFRDRHAVLLQAEYRVPVWGPVDAAVFVDGGTVAAERSGLRFSELRTSHGASLLLLRGAGTAARIDVGFGGGEGSRVFLTIGRDLIP